MEYVKTSGRQILDAINAGGLERHEEIIGKNVAVLTSIEGIDAILIAGSFACGYADVFSDIDLKVVYEPAKISEEQIHRIYFGRINEIGSVVNVYRSLVNHRDYIVYFHPFIKFEMNLKTAEKLRENPRTACCKILHQQGDTGDRIIAHARNLRFNLDDYRGYIQNFAVAFPHLCFQIMGYARRGETAAALDDLHWARNVMLEINGYFLDQPNEGPRRAEKRFPEDVLRHYTGSAAVENNNVKDALLEMISWYKEMLVPLFEKNGIENRKDLTGVMIEVINQFV